MTKTEPSKTKTTREFCAEQIKRLAGKPFYSAECVAELARTLHEYAKNDSHAERVISAAVIRPWGTKPANGEREDRVPSPSDLWGLCIEIPPTDTRIVKASLDCPYCF